MWKCPKCKREFQKTNQAHSCVFYPIENHFKNKEKIAKPLFDTYVKQIGEKIGPVKIESLPCCIHLVSSYTFSAAWALRDRLRIDFRTDKKIKDSRVSRENKISPHRYIYYFDIKKPSDIDSKLIGWLKEAYFLSNPKA